MKDCVLILSGGMDSVTLLYDYQERIELAVSFDYGSNHNAREIPFARLHCERLGIEHLVIPLEFMSHYFHSSLLEGGDVIPEGHYADENMRSTVVPFRNGIMLAVATGLAESRGLQYVMMANHGGDHAIYPDCRPAFVEAFDRTAQAGTYNGVRYLKPETVRYFTKAPFAASNENRRGIGFDKIPINKKGSFTASKSGSMRGYGHTGFTGTFVWADPENQTVIVFLSNRAYPNTDPNLLVRYGIRTQLHDVLYDAYPIGQ